MDRMYNAGNPARVCAPVFPLAVTSAAKHQIAIGVPQTDDNDHGHQGNEQLFHRCCVNFLVDFPARNAAGDDRQAA